MDHQTRAELLREFRSVAEDSIVEWARRWPADSGDSMKATYMDDGTVEIERETPIGFDRTRVRFAVVLIEAEEPNKPTGFVLSRKWSEIPAGWFVRTPGGEWFEVVKTDREAGKQNVSLRSPAGKVGTFPRDPEAKVSIRKGTHTKELSDAIALFGTETGYEILSDEVDE